MCLFLGWSSSALIRLIYCSLDCWFTCSLAPCDFVLVHIDYWRRPVIFSPRWIWEIVQLPNQDQDMQFKLNNRTQIFPVRDWAILYRLQSIIELALVNLTRLLWIYCRLAFALVSNFLLLFLGWQLPPESR